MREDRLTEASSPLYNFANTPNKVRKLPEFVGTTV